MQFNEFREFYAKFEEAELDDKIDLYCTTVNLSQEQYMQLLKTFPPSAIRQLEKALS